MKGSLTVWLFAGVTFAILSAMSGVIYAGGL